MNRYTQFDSAIFQKCHNPFEHFYFILFFGVAERCVSNQQKKKKWQQSKQYV